VPDAVGWSSLSIPKSRSSVAEHGKNCSINLNVEERKEKIRSQCKMELVFICDDSSKNLGITFLGHLIS